MRRLTLTDGTGRWFNLEKAKCWEEATRWNGNNHISLATGSQWHHERLYLTKSGLWVKHFWSQYEGSTDVIQEIDEDQAAAWLSANNHEHDRDQEFEI